MYKQLSSIGFGGIVLITACATEPTVPTTASSVKVEVRKGFNNYTPVARQVSYGNTGVSAPLTTEKTTSSSLSTPRENIPSPQAAATVQDSPALSSAARAGSDILDLKVQKDFDYSSTQDVHVVLSVKNPNQQPYPNVPVSIFALGQDAPLIQGVTSTEGRFEQELRLPAHYQSLQVQVAALGIRNNASLPIQSGYVEAHFGPQIPSSSY